MNGLTTDDGTRAREFSLLIGHDFDNQCDYCEPCRAYHVGYEHDEAVPDQCGDIRLSGFSSANDCRRTAGHDGSHSDINGTEWAVA